MADIQQIAPGCHCAVGNPRLRMSLCLGLTNNIIVKKAEVMDWTSKGACSHDNHKLSGGKE